MAMQQRQFVAAAAEEKKASNAAMLSSSSSSSNHNNQRVESAAFPHQEEQQSGRQPSPILPSEQQRQGEPLHHQGLLLASTANPSQAVNHPNSARGAPNPHSSTTHISSATSQSQSQSQNREPALVKQVSAGPMASQTSLSSQSAYRTYGENRLQHSQTFHTRGAQLVSGQEKKEIFNGVQQDQSWFFGSAKNVNIQVSIDREELQINIRGGIDSKTPKRTFRITELHQVVYYATDCMKDDYRQSQIDPILEYTLCFIFKDRNMEPLEMKLAEVVLNKIKFSLTHLKEQSMMDRKAEPTLQLFVVETAHFQSLSNKVGFAWPDKSTRPKEARLKAKSRQNQDQTPYLSKASTVKHAKTKEGFACLEFQVRKWRSDETGRPLEISTIHVLQNNSSLVTEVRIQGNSAVLEICNATIVQPSETNRIKIVFAYNNEPWILEFENIFKVYQFMQLHQLFRTRAAVKYTDTNQTFSFEHLIPPRIVPKLLGKEESPSNNQDLPTISRNLIQGQVPLEIMCVTWNHAREPQNIDFEALFPDYMNYNIIAFGAQECSGEKEEEATLVADYLGKKNYVQVGFVGKGEIFMAVFVKTFDCVFMRDARKNFIMKDLLSYGWKGGVMIQFTLYDTSFSFINCHLESGQNKVPQRLTMAQEILKEIGLFSEKDQIEPDAMSDINFFMGDLNFRFNSTYTEHIRDVQASPQKFKQLDQLHQAKYETNFPGYEEGEITFMPTYKREKNNNNYINKKDQCPSYTDRILVKNNSNCAMAIREYQAREQYWGSDHRPVYAHFSLISQPQNFLNVPNLLDSRTPVQGHGQLMFKYTMLEFFPGRLMPLLTERYRFPVFITLQFRSDWLISRPLSCQRRIGNEGQEMMPIQWKKDEIPILYTPINSVEILRQKRLIIVVQLNERNKGNKCDNFAYINIPMKNLTPNPGAGLNSREPSQSWDYEITVGEGGAQVIGSNRVLGTFHAVMYFRLVNVPEVPAHQQQQMMQPDSPSDIEPDMEQHLRQNQQEVEEEVKEAAVQQQKPQNHDYINARIQQNDGMAQMQHSHQQQQQQQHNMNSVQAEQAQAVNVNTSTSALDALTLNHVQRLQEEDEGPESSSTMTSTPHLLRQETPSFSQTDSQQELLQQQQQQQPGLVSQQTAQFTSSTTQAAAQQKDNQIQQMQFDQY